ncbi:hypothetical protein GCM10007989_11510 [Devosia pacifica]|uniref:Response regulatory domain-containing protein n=1 Tax=Devosia pacifica TaxID=1335967 RepID=A0A918VR58_9HYPH|nr:response regulator [Devosia pacifica]GHA17966.1 hypothetical protein GCM10007989_11510 [Devosia pacifica]
MLREILFRPVNRRSRRLGDDIGAKPDFAGFQEMAKPARAATILFVDDEEACLALASRAADRAGVRAVVTTDPQNVLLVVRREQPDLVVVDVLMPQFDGWDVLAALRNDVVTRGIPVVMTSVIDQEARALESGARDFVPKPITAEALLRVLAKQEIGSRPAYIDGTVNRAFRLSPERQ